MNSILRRSCVERVEKTVPWDLEAPSATCDGARHVNELLRLTKAGTEKTDRNDALGIAQILRAGWYKTAHVKSDEAHRMRLLLAHRRALKRKAVDLENAVRHTLKAFGVRLHMVGRRQMGAAIADATRHDPLLYDLSQAMLRARDALLAECDAMSLGAQRRLSIWRV